MIEFLISNWAELLVALMAFTKVVVNLIPSEKPIKVWTYIDILISAIVADNVKGAKKKD